MDKTTELPCPDFPVRLFPIIFTPATKFVTVCVGWDIYWLTNLRDICIPTHQGCESLATVLNLVQDNILIAGWRKFMFKIYLPLI